jgi:hypothetical protein
MDKKIFCLTVHFNAKTGVSIMITIFGDFCLLSAKKLAFFFKKQCRDQNFTKISSILNKTTPFFAIRPTLAVF